MSEEMRFKLEIRRMELKAEVREAKKLDAEKKAERLELEAEERELRRLQLEAEIE